LSVWRASALVARREIGERARRRSFQASTALTLLVVAGVALAAGLVGDGDEEFRVGAHGPEAVAVAEAARAAGPALGLRVEVERFAGSAEARAAARDERVDASLVGGAIVSRASPPDELEQALQAAARQVRAAAFLRSEGLSAAEARRALAPPPLDVRRLDASDDRDERQGVAWAASLLLYVQLIIFGVAVASGVVEEKASRVVEVLLAAIPPRALLAGKVVGIGLLGLAQLALAVLVGLGVAAASGAIGLDADYAGILAVVLVWFLLGYALWSLVYAIAGVMVSRQEDLNTSSNPPTMVLVACYLVAFAAFDDPDSTLAVTASLVPLSSPIVMPVRVAVGDASALEIAASLALLAGAIALLVPLGARIYERAVLRMGKPMRIGEAVRAAQGSRRRATARS
jgi:ABC-2 type transport system permease protein